MQQCMALSFHNGGIGNVCLKSPPKTKNFPPKGSGDWQMSCINASTASRTGLEINDALSRMKTSMEQR